MNSIKINKTNILPLRWFANLCGEISSWSILRASWLDEDENYGIRYTIHAKIWKYLWPVYMKWGTMYKLDFDMSGKGWDDYDENGIPYWYFTEWQEDPETGDAWRLIKNAKN